MMKKILVLSLLAESILTGCSNTYQSVSDKEETTQQDPTVQIVNEDIYIDSVQSFLLDGGSLNMGVYTVEITEDNADPYATGYVQNAIIVKKNDRFGFYDYEGNTLSAAEFMSVSQNPWCFFVYKDNNQAYTMNKDLTSYSDVEGGIGGAYPPITIADGKVISNNEPVATPIFEYLPEDELYLVGSENGSGIIDQNGNIICEMNGWYSSVASTFSNGYVFLSDTEWDYDYETEKDSHGSLMLFNTDGEQIMESTVEDAGYMWDGYAPVKKDGKWGFVDENGQFAVECIFESASSLYEGNAYVKYKNQWMIINLVESLKNGSITAESLDIALK